MSVSLGRSCVFLSRSLVFAPVRSFSSCQVAFRNEEPVSSAPLEGIRVLDLTRVLGA